MTKSARKTTVILADDHPIVLKGFATSLTDAGLNVVGEARTPQEASRLYDELQSNVLVLDIRFGGKLTGLDVAKEVLKKHPKANIVFLSQFDEDSLIKEAYKIGARAFVTKASDTETLITAVRHAGVGDVYFLPEIAQRLANLAIRGDKSPQSRLDGREVEIFKLIAQGYTHAEIADKMGLSLKTVGNASQLIKEKLGAHRAADITRMAVKYGLIEP
jgi:DNA-binding NarL/FixJ family response regulator